MQMRSLMGEFRTREQFGKATLSVVGGKMFYSSPRENFGELDDYSAVEVGFLFDGGLCRPSKYDKSLSEFDQYFEDGGSPVAGYMPVEAVKALQEKLTALS